MPLRCVSSVSKAFVAAPEEIPQDVHLNEGRIVEQSETAIGNVWPHCDLKATLPEATTTVTCESRASIMSWSREACSKGAHSEPWYAESLEI